MALRELGRIERTFFMLSWLQSMDLRRRVHAGLNKGKARNALARAVFLCRLGEIRDRSFEQQRYRASGLTLVTAAIALWNTVYIERAVHASDLRGQPVDGGSGSLLLRSFHFGIGTDPQTHRTPDRFYVVKGVYLNATAQM